MDIDGDGCLYFDSNDNIFHIDIVSYSQKIVEQYKNIVYNLLNTPERILKRKINIKSNGNASFQINGKEAYQLGKILYENATIYLQRKYEKYLLAKQKYEPI